MIEAGAEHTLEDLVDWLAGTKFGDRELDDVSGHCRRLLEAGRQVSARGLASGLLAGKFTADTSFPESDHRTFNRDGECFNVGETFAGLPFAKGVELADKGKS